MININKKLSACLDVVRKYEWLLDAYVLDFYVDDHWSKLPQSWRKQLEDLPVEHLSELLQHSDGVARVLWPLELLALRQVLRSLCIRRSPTKQIDVTLPSCPLLEHRKLKHMFMKCVKPKKSHEIKRMAAICARSCQETSISFVVDFGAGVGHLARVLGYGYGINVCCLEMQAALNGQALEIDAKLESMAAKHLDDSETIHFKRPAHLTQRLSSDTTPEQFIESIRHAFQLSDSNFSFGIIGLHPCGDLSGTLMRMFLSCEQAKFLNFVGCCYQKMSTRATHPQMKLHGYPLSSQLQSADNSRLSYEAREIACHAMELYSSRLQSGDYEYLKIHSLRAAAERIIVQHLPELRHSALRNVKHVPGMSFNDYFQKAIEGTQFALLQATSPDQIEADLLHWRRIVCFYTLRLMLAPLVESIILYDRALFLLENGCQVTIESIFNPCISPRNHITSAIKN
ncbi:protein RRNAD1 isoform X1 [Drosophila mojavensis]|uniref:protein RRNAD1 isoform X1 n=1 Tax=Drosophila mojavensis TaxID=7230 RepID=UPI001CD0E1A3|nr:protein RRNAD1 isoform X1 [Drosophila mojavensis]